MKKAIIAGAGPAGLTAAWELLTHTKDVIPVILEKSGAIGGISQTIVYKDKRMDIGGHRFFSKSDRVMAWWLSFLPLALQHKKLVTLTYHQQSRQLNASAFKDFPDIEDEVMLVRNRLSRIYYQRQFFDYPLRLSFATMKQLGWLRLVRIFFSYLYSKIFRIKNEKSLEDFFINRFGRELYKTFFQSYTEKVWGKPCSEISAEWGRQRIKGLSISKAIVHAFKKAFMKEGTVEQKKTETSLIEKFLYPKYGPGQLWEKVAREILQRGGEIHFHCEVTGLVWDSNQITSCHSVDTRTGEKNSFSCDYFFSTMPVRQLIDGMGQQVPAAVRAIAAGLEYRDFITIGVLVKKLKVKNRETHGRIKDNWIYVQDKGVRLGRIQIFNNWSPFMVPASDGTWLGLEYFCSEGDALWNMADAELAQLAVAELEAIGFAKAADVLDHTIVRVEKAYPGYFGTYKQFDTIREFTDGIENLYLIGRNGMHKYNNADHSMLTAMVAVDNIVAGRMDKENIWAVNTETDYHEERAAKG